MPKSARVQTALAAPSLDFSRLAHPCSLSHSHYYALSREYAPGAKILRDHRGHWRTIRDMPNLIKDGAVIANPWQALDKGASLDDALAHEGDRLIVPVALWLEQRAALLASGKRIAVWLDGDESPDLIAGELEQFDLIALNFPKFTDGRAFSSAAILRQRLAYQGELRAIGEVLRDQLFYMRKCGFDSFELGDGVKVEDALSALQDFKTSYQSTAEEPLPLFKRRA